MTSFGDLMARTDLSLYSQLIEVDGTRMIQERIHENLQLYGAWLYGGCQMAGFIWGGALKDEVGEENQEVSDTLAKYCILRMSYTFMRMHPDFSPQIGEDEDRRSFYEDLVYPIIHSWWRNDLERTKIFNEYLVLDTQYSYDLQHDRSNIEPHLFYTQVMNVLRSDLSLDITEVDVPITDIIELTFGASGVLSLGIAERGTVSGGIRYGMDAAVETLRDWPSNWIYPGKIPPNLFADSNTEMEGKIQCPECSHINPLNNMFCAGCGVHFSSQPKDSGIKSMSIQNYVKEKDDSSKRWEKESMTRAQQIGIKKGTTEFKSPVSLEEDLIFEKRELLEFLKKVDPQSFESASNALGQDFLDLTPNQARFISAESRKSLFINTIMKMNDIDQKAILNSFNQNDLENALSLISLGHHTGPESGELRDKAREIIGNPQSLDQEVDEPEESVELHSPNLEEDQPEENLETHSPNLEEDQQEENLETHSPNLEEDQPEGIVQPPSTPEISTLCLECGNDNPVAAKYCIYSGHILPLLICPKCETENIPEAKFCMECGEER